MAKAAPAGSLQRLVEELAPGGRLVRTRRLRGGLGAQMHVLNIETAADARQSFVLRRYVAGWSESSPAHAENEFRVLKLADAAGIPAPRPIFLDAECRFFETPSMVLSYLPGRSFHVPRDTHFWASELARGLAGVHDVTPERFDLSWLPLHQKEAVLEELQKRRLAGAAAALLAAEIIAELDLRLPAIDWSNLSLIHADFHPGNTVFARTKLSGIVDWSQACVGDPRFDVAQCRLDLVVSHGSEVADVFASAYEVASGRSPGDLSFFDLERGLPALYHYEHWLIGYHDAGLTHISAEAAGERLGAFLRSALSRSRSHL